MEVSFATHSDINGPSKLPEVMLVNGMASMVPSPRMYVTDHQNPHGYV